MTASPDRLPTGGRPRPLCTPARHPRRAPTCLLQLPGSLLQARLCRSPLLLSCARLRQRLGALLLRCSHLCPGSSQLLRQLLRGLLLGALSLLKPLSCLPRALQLALQLFGQLQGRHAGTA